MEDKDIVAAVLAGRTEKFAELVDRYLPMVRGLCFSRVYNASVHDDLVQESFLYSFEHLDQLRNRSRFGPWLARIARTRCTDWLRKEQRREALREQVPAEATSDVASDPHSEFDRNELHAWLRIEMGKLPPKTRDAMVLRYVEGLSVPETARLLGVAQSAIKMRLHYGRKRVAETFWKRMADSAPDTRQGDALRNRVLTALPLSAAPWLSGGNTAAAAVTGALGLKTVLPATLVILAATGGGFITWQQILKAPVDSPTTNQRPATHTAPTIPVSAGDSPAPIAPPQERQEPRTTTSGQPASPSTDLHLEGVVRDGQNGRPLRWTKVSASGPAFTAPAEAIRADEHGAFRFGPDGLREGAFTVTCEHPVYETAHVEGVLSANTEPVRFNLERRPHIEGRVLKADGTPAPYVRIARQNNSGAWSGFSVSDAAGWYIGAHDGGSIQLVADALWRRSARADEHLSERATFELGPEESASHDFLFPPTNDLEFHFQTPEGHELDAIARSFLWNRAHSPAIPVAGDVIDRHDEHFMLRYLEPGTYDIAVLFDDYEPVFFEDITVRPDGAVQSFMSPLQTSREGLRVRVIDHMGRRAPGMQVGINAVMREYDDSGRVARESTFHVGSAPKMGSRTTNERGECAFRGLLPVVHRLYVLNRDLVNEDVEVTYPARDTVVLTLAAPQEEAEKRLFAEFEVRDGTRNDAAVARGGADLFVMQPNAYVMGGEPGLRLDLVPGDNLAIFTKPGYTAGFATVSVTDDMMKPGRHFLDVPIQLGDGGTISGYVQDREGYAVPDIGLALYPEAVYNAKIRNVDAPDLEHLGYMLLNGVGRTREGAHIHDSSAVLGRALAQGRKTGDDGYFELPHVPPGTYFVTVDAPNRRDLEASAPVVVAAGKTTGPVTVTYGGAP